MAISKKNYTVNQQVNNYIEMSVPFIAGVFEGKLVYYDGTLIEIADLDPNECYLLYRQLDMYAVELKDVLENSWYLDRRETRPYFNLVKKKLRTTINGLLEMSPKEFIGRSRCYKVAKAKFNTSKNIR